MNRNVGIAIVAGIAIVVGAISFQFFDSSYQRTSSEEYFADMDHSDEKNIKHVVYPENPQMLYGLTINKDKYLLGENIFIKIQGIPLGLTDSVQFFTPDGLLYFDLKFDGNERSSMKHYFRPSLQKGLNIESGGLCEKEDLIGEWTALFASLPKEKLHFQVLDEILPHSEPYYLGCNEKALEIPYVQPSIDE